MQKFLVQLFLFALFAKMSLAADDACSLPIVTGPCRAHVPSYGYNTTSNECERFVYGGCEGNDNRYASLKDCEQACKSE
ncbi:kunitz-type serine protease inhibitor conotoxin Cal9.1d-like [Leguminivora glycinivorella]|uniref:kunitz-type serine protease inhibitor conotoxin Cal9.1d-like n=1 Tax=Leguminivora glycinivorella TaxID=1035111 RepID=UPI00200D1757|nr:kunitz-type serine protease inhibitor conotoxin Cal9.1d-like [Leguminivora glycinivorella]